MKKFRLILLTAVAAVSALVSAQTASSSIARTITYVLPLPKVRAELKLTAEQTKKILAAREELGNAENAAYGKLGPDATNEQAEAVEKEVDQLAETYAKRFAEILDAKQNNRLRQIVLQDLGVQAMRIPSIATELGLTPAQLKSMDALYDKLAKQTEDFQALLAQKLEKLPEPNYNDAESVRKHNAEQMRILKTLDPQAKALMAAEEKADADAVALLTAEQKAKWKAMLGAKFSFKK